MTCVQGHDYEGAADQKCPTCGSPSQELVKSVKKEALGRLKFALPYAVLPPLVAYIIGEVSPVKVEGILGVVVFAAAFIWLVGTLSLIGIAFTFIRPRTVAKWHIKKEEPPTGAPVSP